MVSMYDNLIVLQGSMYKVQYET